MKVFISFLACLALGAASLASASADTTTLTVQLTAQNGSGENGTATLTQAGPDINLVISIPNAPSGPQPAHVHNGTCSSLQGVVYPLTSVVSGASETVIKGVTIDTLLAGKYAINIHKSTADLGTYVSCGNIVPATSM